MKPGPRSQAEELIYAEENIRVDLQHRLQKLLNHMKLTRKELAQRAAMTEAQVSRLFSPDANPSIKTVARLFHALGDECIITSCELEKLAGRTHEFDVSDWGWRDAPVRARVALADVADVEAAIKDAENKYDVSLDQTPASGTRVADRAA